MRSENGTNVQKRSFIEEARRRQIIEASIEVLNEVGYAKASLAKIATKAGISTSLTLYHFQDKQTLMQEVIASIEGSWFAYVQEKLQAVTTLPEQLKVFVEANLAYMGTRPKYFGAIIELYFNARDIPKRVYSGTDDPSLSYLTKLLTDGQKSGVFKKDFNPVMIAVMIRGSIDQFLGYAAMRYTFDLEAYTAQFMAVLNQVVIEERK
jgi:AcrR family transcriptional regulator